MEMKARTILFLLLLGFNIPVPAADQNAGFFDGQKTWCVAKPSTEDKSLLANIDYACSQVDCSRLLQKGCPCSIPDTLINHASVAMNLYYQSHGRNQWNCYFANSGLIIVTDPSYGNCIYE